MEFVQGGGLVSMLGFILCGGPELLGAALCQILKALSFFLLGASETKLFTADRKSVV